MPNIRDGESCWLSANARFAKWLAKFEKEMIAPTMEMIENEKVGMSNPEEVQYAEQAERKEET